NKFLADCPRTFLFSSEEFKDIGFIVRSAIDTELQFRDVLCNVDGRDYIYENDTCSDDCFGYKQVVWAKSSEVGCAKQKCPLSDGSKSYFSLLMCFYTPGDFHQAGRPYEQGSSCSKCPQGSGCMQNQCNAKISSTSKRQ
uniref:SCP domain-containing protein n=1 Tax=Mesocestoides corti TaxID=53468 RepID=A0A5K3FT92_MESCO